MEKGELLVPIVVLQTDKRISVWHISLYLSFLLKWQANKCQNPIAFTRREMMEVAHIKSIATYHKCISQLQEFGYIQYDPSFNPFIGSSVRLLIINS